MIKCVCVCVCVCVCLQGNKEVSAEPTTYSEVIEVKDETEVEQREVSYIFYFG